MASSDARPIPRKNVAYRVTFPILDADGDLVTGATGLDSEVSIDGGAFADCTNEATEIATSSGMYYLDLTSGEMNGDTVAVIIKTSSAGAKTTPMVFYPEEAGDVRADVVQWLGTAPSTPTVAGVPNVNVKTWNDLTTVALPLVPTTAGRTLDVSAGGEAGIDWANVGTPGSTVNLSATTTNLVNTVTTYTGNTPQTGDSYAIVNSGVHGNAAIKGYVDDIGVAGAGLTAVPWNAAWDAEVQSEVDDALVAQRLDELLNADSDLDGLAPPTVGSVFHELMTKTAGSFTFDQTTDSLEAIRDRGDAAWITATGFSTHSAADVWAVATRVLTAGTNIQLPANGLANVTAWTVAITGNITGNLSGSVGSVTGAVGSIATGGIAAASFAAGAIDAAAIATNAIDADAIAASAVTEIQSGLSTLDAAGVRTAVGLAAANLDTQLDTLPTAAEIATAVDGIVIETGYSLGATLRIVAAATAGAETGGPGSPVFVGLSGTTRISGTADSSGNRSGITYTP